MTEERRRSHRVKVPLDVAVESDGSVWQGKTVHLSQTSLILLFLDLNNEDTSDSRLSSKLSRPKRLRLLG